MCKHGEIPELRTPRFSPNKEMLALLKISRFTRETVCVAFGSTAPESFGAYGHLRVQYLRALSLFA